MTRVTSTVALIVLTLAALLVAGCGGDGEGGDLTIAMVTHGDEGSFWSVVRRGAEQAAEEQGVRLIWSPSSNDPQRQAELIDSAVSQEVDGLAVSVPNADAIRGPLERARRAGIPIITLNSGADDFRELGAITHVGQTERVAGEAAGERLGSGGATKVVCVIHEQDNVGLQQRCDGVEAGFEGEVTDLRVRGTADISATQAEIRSALEVDASVDAIISLDPDIAAAAVAAARGAGSQATIATFDLSPDVIGWITDGTVEFAVDQQQYLQGYLPIVFLKLFTANANTVGGGLPVLTGPGFVDRSNAATVEQLAGAGTR